MRISSLLASSLVFATLWTVPGGVAWALDLTVQYENAQVMKPIHDEIARRLHEQRPDVDVHFTVATDYSAMLEATLRGALTGSMADLAFHGHNNIAFLADTGHIVPLDGLVLGEGSQTSMQLPAAMQEVGRFHGKVYAVPFTVSVPMVYFNLDLIKQTGGDVSHLPQTWPEIVALATKIDAPSGGMFFTYNATGSWTFMALIESLGGHILDIEGKHVAFNSDAGLRAMQILAEIGKVRHGVDLTQEQARQAFAAGTLGIMVDTSSRIATYEKQSAGKFALVATPFPIVDQGKIPPSGTSAAVQTTDPAKQQAAAAYVKIAISPDIQRLILQKASFLPADTNAIENDPGLKQLFSSSPDLQAAAVRLTNLTAWTAFPGPNSLRIHRDIADVLQQLLTLKISPDDALKAITSSTEASLSQG